MLVLGIDPGVGHTGWAVVDPKTKEVVFLGTIRLKDGPGICRKLWEVPGPPSELLIAVQVAAEIGKPAPYFRKGRDGKAVGQMAVTKNNGLAYLIVGYLRGLGCKVVTVLPQRGKGMKMDAKTWALYWNYQKRCSEDARDAAQIALIGAEEMR